MSNVNGPATRRQLHELLGDLPDRSRPIRVISRATRASPGYDLETLLLDLNGLEPVPAYFVRPRGATGRLPTVLFNHSHGGEYQIGKDELFNGRTYMLKPGYATPLVEQGYAVLCIDHWAFGQRATVTELDLFKLMLWRGQVMWGMMVYDSLRAIDYLLGREDVDGSRLATLGMSMGSTMAWWVAALDERVKVCIDICCLTDFDALIEARGIKGHGIFYFVPRLLKQFTTSRINELIVPRPHLAVAGNLDPLTPPGGLDRIDADMKRAYAEAGVPERWVLHREDVAHQETPEMRRLVMAFLKRWLVA
jgi:dienelactone hydrolase